MEKPPSLKLTLTVAIVSTLIFGIFLIRIIVAGFNSTDLQITQGNGRWGPHIDFGSAVIPLVALLFASVCWWSIFNTLKGRRK